MKCLSPSVGKEYLGFRNSNYLCVTYNLIIVIDKADASTCQLCTIEIDCTSLHRNKLDGYVHGCLSTH